MASRPFASPINPSGTWPGSDSFKILPPFRHKRPSDVFPQNKREDNMKPTTITQVTLFTAATFLLAACSSTVQTSSGQAYLERYNEQARPYQPPSTVPGTTAADRLAPDILAAAAVEPVLTFPAKIGIARLDDGYLSVIPPGEAESWSALAERLGPNWGQFVPINPLIVGLATNKDVLPIQHRSGYRGNVSRGGELINDIRVGAARQHVDAVLIYETAGKSENTSTPFAVTKLLLVGFWLAPTQYVEAKAVASAMLVDVRNGYTYGTAFGVAGDPASALSTSVNEDEAEDRVLLRSKTRAVAALTTEVEQMARDLRVELAESRAQQLEAKPAAQ
jgi:hypothetical protein